MINPEAIRSALDRALASEKGIRIYEESIPRIISLRARIHKARARDRQDSYKIYPEHDPKRGTSSYDILSVVTPPAIVSAKKRPDGTWPELPKEELFLEIVKNGDERLQMEEIQ